MSQNADISFLLTDQRLSGSRRVSITIRPLRVAYLVHPSDPATALSAIRIACRLWGGSFHMLFPCPAGEQPEPAWGKIIERYDPDALVDLVGVSPVYLECQRDEHDRIVLTDPTRPDLDEVIGAPVFS